MVVQQQKRLPWRRQRYVRQTMPRQRTMRVWIDLEVDIAGLVC